MVNVDTRGAGRAIPITAASSCRPASARRWSPTAIRARAISSSPPTATCTSRVKAAAAAVPRRRRRRAARQGRRRKARDERDVRHRQHHRHRAAQRLSLRREVQLGRTLQDDARPAEAGGRAPRSSSADCPAWRSTATRGSRSTARAALYVNVGAPSNACQEPDRRPGAKGQDPCPLLEKNGGIWKFDENKLGQKQEDGTRFATGLRQMPGIAWHDDALYISMNNRDQLDAFWPDTFKQEDNANRPAEPLYRAVQGVELRLAVLLLRLHAEEAPAQPGVRRRRQDASARCASSRRRWRLSRALGAGRHDVLHRHAVSAGSTAAARSSPSTARGIARRSRRATTSRSSRSRTARRRERSKSSPTASPARRRR